jgi:hypothetical protein
MNCMKSESTETIEDLDYDLFVETGYVSTKVLNQIADIVTSYEQFMSPREYAIFCDKTKEVNELILNRVKECQSTKLSS